MINYVRMFMSKIFWSDEKIADYMVDRIKVVLKDLTETYPFLTIGISANAHIVLIDKTSNTVIAVINIGNYGHKSAVVVNTESGLFDKGQTIVDIVKQHNVGKVVVEHILLAYNPDWGTILLGKYAEKYLEKQNKKKPNLTLLNPEDLN